MLKKLSIQQFVIIDKLEINFQPSLTILTGETGAGKSILLGAMGLILGEPSKPEAIRQGSDEAVIEALFAPSRDQLVWKFLMEQGLVKESDTEFLIHRTITTDGREDIRFNGKPIERELLEEIGTFLVEIHGQFANQNLTNPANQLKWLDLSGDFPPEVFKNVADALHNVHRYTKELEEEKIFLARHKGLAGRKVEDLIRKFNKIGMKKDFNEEIKAEYDVLLRAKETSEAFQRILGQLIAGNGVVVSLSTANRTLASQKNLDNEKMVDLTRFLAASLDNARKAVDEMNRIIPEYEIDTDPIYRCEKILAILDEISRETKIPFEGLSDLYEETDEKYQRMRNGRERLAELQDLLIGAKNDYRHHAHILTEKRIVAGKALSEAITAELPPLKLMKAEFDVLVEEKPDIEWTDRGFNEVTFIARMNPGTPFSPIAKTASGGEMARMVLALKVILQKVQTTPTLIFDEVDTGIGGPAAAAVGERIAQLADNTQVLVITHSPQVASRGHQHLHVSKKTDGMTTTSTVSTLSPEERIDEISRMLAGDTLTAESKAAAKSLIDEALAAAKLRQQKSGKE